MYFGKFRSVFFLVFIIIGGLLGSRLSAEEDRSRDAASALLKEAIPLRITAEWDEARQSMKIGFENLTSKPIFINKLSIKNPKVLLYAKVGTSFKAQFFFTGLSTSGLGSALRQLKDLSDEVQEIAPKSNFEANIEVGAQLKQFTEAIPDAIGQKIRLKLEFSQLIADISKSLPHDSSAAESSEAFFTPWIPVSVK